MAKVFYDKSKNIAAYHPGYYIQDIIAEDKDAKEILLIGIGKKELDELIQGTLDVDREIAKKLETCTGVDKLTWLAIQKSYDEKTGSNKYKYAIENTFIEEYKCAVKDMLIIITLITLCLCPLLFFPLIASLILLPIQLNLNLINKIIYYNIVLFFVIPLMIIGFRKLKDMFKNTIKFMISKLS